MLDEVAALKRIARAQRHYDYAQEELCRAVCRLAWAYSPLSPHTYRSDISDLTGDIA